MRKEPGVSDSLIAETYMYMMHQDWIGLAGLNWFGFSIFILLALFLFGNMFPGFW